MKLLNDFDGPDPVSQLLRTVRVRSTIYCRSELRAPWGFAVDGRGHPAFHLVSEGRCWLEVEGEPAKVALKRGDLVLLPAGSPHAMRDHPSSLVTGLDEILATTAAAGKRLTHGGQGALSVLLCGGFALEGGPAHPVLHALPKTLVIRGDDARPSPALAATIQMLSAEIDSRAPGAEEVTARLADALLMQALRCALVELHASNEAAVRALRDRQVASAIALIQSRPERAWTVSELATELSLSRSTFTARFRKAVGESPARYLTRARLAHAALLLRTSDSSLAVVAARAGYASEFSFGRAFKREFGIAPGAYRGKAGERPAFELAASG
jgi:AraC-like DNA-binding protein